MLSGKILIEDALNMPSVYGQDKKDKNNKNYSWMRWDNWDLFFKHFFSFSS